MINYLQFRNLQITNIQTIGFPEGNPEDTLESIFDILPVVDLNGVVERGDDLDFHSGLDVDAVAAFAAFGSYSVECHNKFSFSCYSFAKASKSIKTYKYYQVHIGTYSKKRRNVCTSRLLASDGLPTNEQTLRPKAQQPNVGDHSFLMSEFRDASVKCSLKVCVFV